MYSVVVDSDRLAFTRTHRVARRTTASNPVFPPQALNDAAAKATGEILFDMPRHGAGEARRASSNARQC